MPKEYGALAGGTLTDNFARLEAGVRTGRSHYHVLLALHEHVAHFSPTSLRRLAERAGLEVLDAHALNGGTLSLLARKP